ncbi:sporulation protein YpjB [Jeotgalibacillus sp. R-1-5s-1]|uniref:sporulation protein YpjB n=1 Tax=Jeotgalibacillus sp. R-1-5s-1 TaxID=2555897 RepID=UPI00141B7F09|nr:sporulation protein YpjB [Jeotgalibacillus sp. R-1-5s-1]
MYNLTVLLSGSFIIHTLQDLIRFIINVSESMHPLLFLGLFISTSVISTLSYVSWRKYVGERNRKNIRDHNN